MRKTEQRMPEQSRFVSGMLIGAGLMYLVDPDRGRRRRALLRDQGIHLAHRAEEASGTTARDVRNRAIGTLAGMRSRIRDGAAPDQVIEARVRTKLGRVVAHPGAIDVSVLDGRAVLRGAVLADELSRMLACVSGVKGVREVRNELSVHERAGREPSLQGNGRRRTKRVDLLQDSWAPATRLLVGLAGGALTTRGLRGEGLLSAVAAVTGLTLLARALTNLDARRLTGVHAGRRAIDVHKIITVKAPLDEVFSFWSNLENLPRFMDHLVDVRDTGEGRSYWTAEGPLGIRISWDAELTALRDRELIAWKSVGKTPVGNAGIVRFQEVGEGATRVDVRMSYNPPAGAIGHVVASLFGVDPKRAMDDDLVRLKSLLEEGRTRAEGRRVTREDFRSHIPIEAGAD